MNLHRSTPAQLNDHLGQAEFSLKVAANFDCLKGTPAHQQVCEALAQVALARTHVREQIATERPLAPRPASAGEGLPLTRKERLGYRWP